MSFHKVIIIVNLHLQTQVKSYSKTLPFVCKFVAWFVAVLHVLRY